MNRRTVLEIASCVGVVAIAGCTSSLDQVGGYDPDDVKENAETIPYEELFRNISEYEGDPVHYSNLRVTDILESEDGYQEYVLSMPDSGWGNSKVLYGVWEGDPFRRRGTVEIWGIVTGTETYMSMSGEKTVPNIEIVVIEITG